MSLLSIDIGCGNCGHTWDALVERPAPDVGEQVPHMICPECAHCESDRIPSAPTNLRASFPDGYRRGAGYEALKESARLKSERANRPNTDAARADINAEITKVQKAASRGYTKSHKVPK